MDKEERRKYAVAWRVKNKKKIGDYSKEYRKTHKKEISDNGKDYYSSHKNEINNRHKNYYKNHRESLLSNSKKYKKERRRKIKQEIFELLGGQCTNPYGLHDKQFRDIQCLQIDHINGGGKRDIQRFKSTELYFEYILNQIQAGSKDYQLLCANCNWKKRWENGECNGKKKND